MEQAAPASTESTFNASQIQQSFDPTNQVGNDQRIASFGESFLQNLAEDRDPDQMGGQPQQEATEAPDAAEQPDTEQEAEAQPSEELDRFELDGQEYELPKALAEKLKEIRGSGLRQEDYTRKTQELAASRKQVDQLTTAAQKAMSEVQQLAPLYAQKFALQQQVQAIQQQLTPEARQNDPIEFSNNLGMLAILQQQLGQFDSQLQQVQGQHKEQLTQLRKQAMAEKVPELFKQFPDLQKPDVQAGLRDFAQNQGFSDEAIEWMNFSPEAVKVLYMAQSYQKMLAKQAEVKKTIKANPAAKPNSRPQPVDSQKSAEAWKKNGGKMTDPNFDALLRKRIGT